MPVLPATCGRTAASVSLRGTLGGRATWGRQRAGRGTGGARRAEAALRELARPRARERVRVRALAVRAAQQLRARLRLLGRLLVPMAYTHVRRLAISSWRMQRFYRA